MSILTQLDTFLHEDGWFPHQIENQTAYVMNYSGNNVHLLCYAQLKEEIENIFFYAKAPHTIPEELRAEVAKYVTIANYGLRIGNFELDVSDGDLRYKCCLSYRNETDVKAWLENAIYPSVTTMNRYYPGLMLVLYGGLSAEEAYKSITE